MSNRDYHKDGDGDSRCYHANYEIVEAHPWQELERAEVPDSYDVTDEGAMLECHCLDCGLVFLIDGPTLGNEGGLV